MARTAHSSITELGPKLYVALELSKDTWKLAFTRSRIGKARIRDVPARDQPAFLEEIRAAKERHGLASDAPVLSCYEAGRDGFWIHRFLEANGIANLVVDPASIEVDRRSRRAKTDRIDAQKLVQLLARHGDGEDVLRVVRVPPLNAEDERLLPRQLWTLKRKRVRRGNQIRAALFLHGVDIDPRKGNLAEQEFLGKLEDARQWDGSPLPPELVSVVRMHWEDFALITRQIKTLEQRQRELLRKARTEGGKPPAAHAKAAKLTQLRGIGDVGALVLVTAGARRVEAATTPDERVGMRALLGSMFGLVLLAMLLATVASTFIASQYSNIFSSVFELGEEEIEAYVATGEWRGRAGGYAVQGLGSSLVTGIEGDLSNVIGLPLPLVARLVQAAAVVSD